MFFADLFMFSFIITNIDSMGIQFNVLFGWYVEADSMLIM